MNRKSRSIICIFLFSILLVTGPYAGVSGGEESNIDTTAASRFQTENREYTEQLTGGFKFVVLADPMIGTGGHGHTYPGATLPFGMVQLSPDTRLTGWDGCSAYHYSDNYIYGFSHTHLSGTGCSDYGDILLMPVSIDPDDPEARPPLNNGANEEKGYRSSFYHSSETVVPGFYSVYLSDHRINVRLSATSRCGFHQYSFPEGSGASVVLDLTHRDKVIDSALNLISETEVTGFRRSQAWAKDQHVYFVAKFSRPIVKHSISVDGVEDPGAPEGSGIDVRAWFSFEPGDDRVVMVKVGISAVDIEGARKNLDAELPGWDFDETAKQAIAVWDESLRRIKVDGGTKIQKRTFYTALYHSLLAPNLYSDVDSRYRGRDLEIHKADDFDYYTVFSLWDTYRAAHPLFTILEPERTIDFIKTFLRQHEQGGALPIWELGANETGCMIGYHAVPVIVDAYIKGIDGFDGEVALAAMKSSASQDHNGLDSYKYNGYITSEDAGQSVSRTLEYAYDDWCIAKMAGLLGHRGDESKFLRRAQSYKNLFDPSTGFMKARLNGGWVEPFDPAEVNYHYTEANSWQYSFYVPHDVSGLAAMHGGMNKLEAKLDSLFEQSQLLKGFEQPDVSGLIGQYAHGNEPSQHMASLYNFTGSPWKAQKRLREIMDKMYGDKPDGLCGNEDCGQMSAWYVLNAIGFYPVTPGQDIYIIGTPLFDSAEIDMGKRNKFTITANRESPGDIYIQSASLNGKKYDRSFISHRNITNGSTFEFELGPEPSPVWGKGKGNLPVSAIDREVICPAPYIDTTGRRFIKSLTLSYSCADKDAGIRYTTDGSEPDENAAQYTDPFTITESATIKAIAFKEGILPSSTVESRFILLDGAVSVTLGSESNSMYTGGGPLGLIDLIRGGDRFRTGAWLGFRGVDFEAVIDYGDVRGFRSVSAGFLHDQGAWIFLPREVEFAISSDGDSFDIIGHLNNPIDDKEEKAQLWEAAITDMNKKGRYLRVRGKTIGLCPPWHIGSGSKGWIFIDEITVE